MPAPPWKTEKGVSSVVRGWLDEGRVRPCLAAERLIPAAKARYAGMPSLTPGLREALRKKGIEQLFTHQVTAIEASLRGKHVVVATPTASGKSLCFHLPVLQALTQDPSGTALFLYPTKALSRDQEHSLHDVIRESGLSLPSVVFDGDTPGDARRKAREKGRIILTNPDMLHSGILPNHHKWASFFQGLKYVVLDEMHTYRGVFGSHMAHVLARLKRISAFHGAKPLFIGATATIGNPLEHAMRLMGERAEDITLVEESGAPQNSRRVFLYNPPIVNQELGIRASTLKAAVSLASDLISAQVPTILFGPSRNSVEVMLKYLRERSSAPLQHRGISVERAVMGYRGGYLPKMRRSIEQGLRDGEILGVVATNALELGIDIGDLDAVICAGYPGSVAGTWQRFGRAGRRASESVAVMVCGSGSVDQFLARQPEFLLERKAEEARIDPSNAEIVIQHLKCAAFEAPFRAASNHTPSREASEAEVPRAGESYATLDEASTEDALKYLSGHGVLHFDGQRFHFAGEAFPASQVSLRNVGWDNFVIVDQGTPERPEERTIGELDYRAAHTMLHEQAIYQQDAEQYQVEKLDFENHKAFVRKVAPDYFTTALTYRTVSVLEIAKQATAGRGRQGFGDVKVLERVTGYKKIKFFTHENSGYGDVHLPEMEMHTTSYWLTLPEDVLTSLNTPRALLVDALRGLGHALETVSALYLMCDPRDLNQTLGDGGSEPHWDSNAALSGKASPSAESLVPGREPARLARESGAQARIGDLDPTLFLFDALPGGVGLAERIFERSGELFLDTRTLIEKCPCAMGCPACVGPVENAGRRPLALKLLDCFIC